MKTAFITLIFLCITSGISKAGTPEHIIITGEVVDTDGEKLSGIFISISNPCEAGKSLHTISENGRFRLVVVPCDSYRLLCISGAHDSLNQTIFGGPDSIIEVFLKLTPAADRLKEAEIIRYKNAVTIKGEKTIVNADQISPGATATALDLLLRCPGVIVDEQNNILRLKGKNGVMVMVDDRLQPISGEDLFNWLRNTPAGQIDRIELISNPSARYDASGNAGIINFHMKRNRQQGLNGSFSSGLGQGRYGKLNEGLSVNYRKNKTALNFNYNYSLRKAFNELNLQRDFFSSDTLTGSYRQRNYLRFPVNNHALRVALDHKFSNKISAGFNGNYNATRLDPNGKNYSDILGSDGSVVSYFSTINQSHDKRVNGSVSGYFRASLDTSGSYLSIDADAALFSNQSDQLFTTEYFDNNYFKNLPDYLLSGNLNGQLNILAGKADWVQKIKRNHLLETGIKASRVTSDNNVLFRDISDGKNITDSSKSNHFIYTENIAAGYVQTAGSWHGFEYQIGIRTENTKAIGIQKISDEHFNRNYLQWFPSMSLQKKMKSGKITGFSMSRRIQRPAYGQLNPFKFYLDPTTYRAGNPWLNPELTWNAELQYILVKGTSFSLGINHTNRIITEVIYPSEQDPKVTVQTNKNLNTFRNLIFTASTPLKIGKKCNGFWTLNASLQNFIGNIASTPLNRKGVTIDFNGMQTYNINSHWTADLSASFQSSQPYAYMSLRPLGQLGLGIQRTMLKKSATVKLSCTDIFFTGNPIGETDFTGYHEKFEVHRETQVAMLTFSYRFGTQQQQQRRRPGGAEEEKQRAQSGLG